MGGMKLQRKADKMAARSENIAAKASNAEGQRALKLAKKAASVQAKAQHLHGLASGMQLDAQDQPDADGKSEPKNRVGGGDGSFVEQFTVLAVNPTLTGPAQTEDQVQHQGQDELLAAEDSFDDAELVSMPGDGSDEEADHVHSKEEQEDQQQQQQEQEQQQQMPQQYEEQLATMVSLMGFARREALDALQEHGGDVQLAVSQLIAQ